MTTSRTAVVSSARSAAVLSPSERRYLAEYARHGDYHAVATCVGQSFFTIKNALAAAYRKLGASSAIEAFYRIGWLRFPLEHAA